ncbi:MAG: Fic family protein [Deltaproteobacteria bacterium]|nr:Fic family protein [Deltaproteobacteria bacterium]
MKRLRTGDIVASSVGGETVNAFVPAPLPPEPKIEWNESLHLTYERALNSLGRLDGMASVLPSPDIFLYAYVRKEALLSSQIEGTQSTLADLLKFEAGDTPLAFDDVREVSNYVDAAEFGVRRIKKLPISSRLMRELHERLLKSGRGNSKDPGAFRRSQNWIGGSRPGNALFVPPPHARIAECIANLETFIHDQPEKTPALVKAAVAHVQFETIHPFLDGNGRVGRLLIVLVLISEGLLRQPLLYLSLYLKEHRGEYYDLLQRVRAEGDWEAWLEFFFRGVHETADAAVATATTLLKLFHRDNDRVEQLGRPGITAQRVLKAFQGAPILSAKQIVEKSGATLATVNRALEQLESLRIVREVTGRKRDRLWAYSAYIAELSKGTAPLPQEFR